MHARRNRHLTLFIPVLLLVAAARPAAAKGKGSKTPPPSSDSDTDSAMDGDTRSDSIAWTIEDNSRHNRPQELALTLSLWPDSLGASVWYAFPVAPDGFIRAINDSFAIEVGGTLAFVRAANWGGTGPTYYGLIPAVGGRWNFHLTRDWTAFSTLKLGVLFGLGAPGFYNNDWVDVGFTLGALYRLQQSMQLRLELGYPFGLSVGLNFPLGG